MCKPFACVGVFLLCCGAAAAQETPTQLLTRFADAWKSGQVEILVSFYEPSEKTVVIASSGESYHSITQVRKMYEAAFEEALWEEVRLDRLQIVQDGDIAWGTCRFNANFRLKADGTRLGFTSQGSFVLRRRGDSWRIVLEHFSPIAGEERIRARP